MSTVATARPRGEGLQAKRLAAALALAAEGFAIVPIPESRKAPREDEWQHLASRDPDVIRGWLQREGQYGVLPQAGSRLLVIDVDVPSAVGDFPPLPTTLTVDTAKGYHVYGRLPGGVEEADVPRTFAGGEVRVAGSGQVVGPYSRHPSGATYIPRDGADVLELSPDLLAALRQSHDRKLTATREARGPEDEGWRIPEPGRHDFLLARARNLRGVGLSGERLLAEVKRLNQERCTPPKTDDEIRSIVEWVEHNITDDPPPITLVMNKPDPDAASGPEVPTPSIDAVDLLALDLPPLRMIVPDLIPEGTTVIASPPKVGKSCLVYQVAVEVAIGGELFGKRVSPGSVLYLALEDGQRRGQGRLSAALEGRTLPRDRLTVQWGARRIGQGLEDDIRAWLDAHPDAAVVAIDTLQRVGQRRPASATPTRSTWRIWRDCRTSSAIAMSPC